MLRDNNTLIVSRPDTGGKLWRPIRPIREFNEADDVIARLQSAVTPTATPGTTGAATTTGAPRQLLSISATASPAAQQDRTFSLVSVSFTRDGGDAAYGFTRIYLRGYKGNTGRVLQTEGKESPISFLLETTGETISIIGAPVGADGTPADIDLAMSAVVTLDGVTSAPPAPTVTQTAVPAPAAIQFTFSQLSGLVADVVDTYRIYRNTANDSSTATRIQTVKHDPKNAGAVVITDAAIFANTTYYYWVTAVNTQGLESSFAVAGSCQGNFSILVETVNLFANPAMTGSGTLPGISGLTVEQWQGGAVGGTAPEYRNGREVKLPAISVISGTTNYCQVGQAKDLARFKPGQIVTLSFRVRRGGLVSNPNGVFVVRIESLDATTGLGIPGSPELTTTSINVSDLSATEYKLYRITGTLNAIGGQGTWFFALRALSDQDDVYVTEPMLNAGNDASAFTTNTFLSDIPQFAYEGDSFVTDDFTDTNGTNIQSHYPSSGGVAWAGKGKTWVRTLETGTTEIQIKNSGTRAELNYTAGSNQQTFANNEKTAASVAYAVQATCNSGAGTGGTAFSSAGVIARYVDSNNFYVALLNNAGNVQLFKRVAGVYTNLGTVAVGTTNATVKLQVTDAAKKVYVNGVLQITSADNALTAAGKAGLRCEANYATSITTAPNVDDLSAFYVQNVAAPATPPVTPPTPPEPINFDFDVEPDKRTL
jgi:hypothetical protein